MLLYDPARKRKNDITRWWGLAIYVLVGYFTYGYYYNTTVGDFWTTESNASAGAIFAGTFWPVYWAFNVLALVGEFFIYLTKGLV